jgi:hypothetical protein
LKSSNSILILNMAHNGLEEAGCMYFGEMLRENSSLVELDLSATRMGQRLTLVHFSPQRKHFVWDTSGPFSGLLGHYSSQSGHKTAL